MVLQPEFQQNYMGQEIFLILREPHSAINPGYITASKDDILSNSCTLEEVESSNFTLPLYRHHPTLLVTGWHPGVKLYIVIQPTNHIPNFGPDYM